MGRNNKIPAFIPALVMAFALAACGIEPEPTVPETTVPAETEPQPVVAVCYMDTLPESWGPLAEQTGEVAFLRNLTAPGLYRLSSDGSEIVPHMAAALPLDVTAEYAGQYNVPGDASRGYAFRIDLNAAACWEDGASITADDYITSLEMLLAEEDRAAEFLFLANVWGFLRGESRPAERVVSLHDGGFGSMAAAREAGVTEFYLDMATFWGLGEGWQSVNDRTRYRDYAMPAGLNEQFVSAAYLYDTYLADGADYEYLQREFVGVSENPENKLTLQDVGIQKTGAYQITLILDQPTTADALALKIADFPLMTGEGRSCGPYRVVSADAQLIELAPSENWWGDGAECTADILKIRLP